MNFFSFELWAKLFGEEHLGFGQPNLIKCLSEEQVDKTIFLLPCMDNKVVRE